MGPLRPIIDFEAFRHLTGLGAFLARFVEEKLKSLLDAGVDFFGLILTQDGNEWALHKAPRLPADGDEPFFEVHTQGHVLNMPLALLLRDAKINAGRGSLVYVHSMTCQTISGDETPERSTMIYVGQTRRGWQKRLQQHRRSASRGSNTLFHRAIREHKGHIGLTHVYRAGLTVDEADELEERTIARMSLYPLGLNMIPGGKAGAKFLFQHADPRAAVDADSREETLSEVIRQSRVPGANPALSARWSNDAFAIRMICSQANRLNPEQIKSARLLAAAGHDITSVTSMVGARNEAQVKRLLTGSTYSRVT